jgi:hypothetical protein
MASFSSSASMSDNHRCKVYGEGKATAVPRVEDIPSESRQRHRVDRPIRGSDNLYGLLLLHHDRRQILWLGVTAHPTAECHSACNIDPLCRGIGVQKKLDADEGSNLKAD